MQCTHDRHIEKSGAAREGGEQIPRRRPGPICKLSGATCPPMGAGGCSKHCATGKPVPWPAPQSPLRRFAKETRPTACWPWPAPPLTMRRALASRVRIDTHSRFRMQLLVGRRNSMLMFQLQLFGGMLMLANLSTLTFARAMSAPGVEPGLLRPQRDVLTTRRCGLSAFIWSQTIQDHTN